MSNYRVTVYEWRRLEAFIEAPSQEAAERIGNSLWYDAGDAAFRFRDGGTDDIIVEIDAS